MKPETFIRPIFVGRNCYNHQPIYKYQFVYKDQFINIYSLPIYNTTEEAEVALNLIVNTISK